MRLIVAFLFVCQISTAQYINPERLMSDKRKSRISRVEKIAGATLIGSAVVVANLWQTRQGIEIPMFTFGVILLMEGNRLAETRQQKLRIKEMRY